MNDPCMMLKSFHVIPLIIQLVWFKYEGFFIKLPMTLCWSTDLVRICPQFLHIYLLCKSCKRPTYVCRVLAYNQLTGTIPRELAALNGLERVCVWERAYILSLPILLILDIPLRTTRNCRCTIIWSFMHEKWRIHPLTLLFWNLAWFLY